MKMPRKKKFSKEFKLGVMITMLTLIFSTALTLMTWLNPIANNVILHEYDKESNLDLKLTIGTKVFLTRADGTIVDLGMTK